jgi:predicted alpha/beta-hydrolase family hydrolase
MNREDRAPTRAAGGAAPKTPGVAEEARGTDAAGADGVRRTVRALDTPHGSARAHAWTPPQPVGALVLSHGAGAGSGDWTPDLAALTRLATDPRPWQVVLVEQPWKVAGRKVAAPPRQLDAAWLAILAGLRAGPDRLAVPLVVGGRSAGARVACRTAGAVGADGVLALAFPLHPPGKPAASRAAELVGVAVPVLVVQGGTDPFGRPAEIRAAVPEAPVVAVAGGHGFSRDPGDVVAAVRDWLTNRYAGECVPADPR